MSLYNMLFGVRSIAPLLLECLELTYGDIPRFRDCYLAAGSIVVYTRTGGGNRDYYESEESCREHYPSYFEGNKEDHPQGPWNDDLRNHPCYTQDEDDSFDSTYALFYFKYPEKWRNDLEALSKQTSEYNPSEQWLKLLESFNK